LFVEYATVKTRRGQPLSRWLDQLQFHLRGGVGDAEQMSSIEVRTLGSLDVFANAEAVSDLSWGTSKAKEMFLYLVVKGGPSTKDEIVEALWPGLSASKADSYFHSNLHRIRRLLGAKSVLRNGPRYALNPQIQIKADVIEFMKAIEAARFRGGMPYDELRGAVYTYRGAFAPEVYSDWATGVRTRLEDSYVWALDTLIQEARSADELVGLCQKMIEVDPFHERAWEELIRHHRDRGLIGASLQLYRRCTDAFARQLGVEVPPSIASLMRSA
jgi:two-component SAPR family response regulator